MSDFPSNLPMKKQDIGTFDPNAEYSVLERGLPHWSQAGSVCFVSWRLHDSLPRSVLAQLDGEIESLLRRNGLTISSWCSNRQSIANKLVDDLVRKMFAIREKFLDQGYGDCVLAQPRCANIVIDSLRYFDEQRYFLTDAIVMPNHVHFLCAFRAETEMLSQCRSWKRFTANAVNKKLGRRGPLWQVDQFDRLVRSDAEFEKFRRYIAENPKRAGLEAGTWMHWSKKL
jgi:type I restriction enzyme R subunit